jgi:cytochrome b
MQSARLPATANPLWFGFLMDAPRMNEPVASVQVRVWDLPTRVFHWLLAAGVLAQLVTGRLGERGLLWHQWIGLAIGALIVFRIVWGVVGGRWSRFSSFVYRPGTVLRYLRGERRSDDHFDVGHNPLGSFSVLALLALLAVQVATGTVADDEVSTTGPLNRFVSNANALSATAWHKGWGQWLLVALVVLHVGAIVYYRRKGTNLLAPMLSGDKALPPGVPAATDSPATRLLALVLLALCAAAAIWIGRLGG